MTERLKEALARKAESVLRSRKFAAALHLPVAGALLCMVFGFFIAKKWRTLGEDVKLGVAAQFGFPILFLAGLAARYLFWLFWFEWANSIMHYVLSAYMAAAYAAMLLAAFSIYTGRGFRYWRLKQILLGFADWLFG